MEQESKQFHHITVGQQGRLLDESLQHTATSTEPMRPLRPGQPRHLMGKGFLVIGRLAEMPLRLVALLPELVQFLTYGSHPQSVNCSVCFCRVCRDLFLPGCLPGVSSPLVRSGLFHHGGTISEDISTLARSFTCQGSPQRVAPADDLILEEISVFPEGQGGHLCPHNRPSEGILPLQRGFPRKTPLPVLAGARLMF